MATDAELAFADQVGRYFARHYGLPPVTVASPGGC